LRDYVIAQASDEKPLAMIAVLHGRRNPKSDRGHTSRKNLSRFPSTSLIRAGFVPRIVRASK
jgi:hypothetical protein